jgi:hypothetical protein
MVPDVPITPIAFRLGREATRRTHGSTIPTTGILYILRSTGRAREDAVLQATTSSFMSCREIRKLAISMEYLVTVSFDLVPYGTLAVSPR